MTQSKFIIDHIYWERIQLYIEGHVEGIALNDKAIYLRNLTETKQLLANQVTIEDNHFTARFNVAILDDGNYLPSGEYLVVYKGDYDYIAQVNDTLLDPTNYELSEEAIEQYETQETINSKHNFY